MILTSSYVITSPSSTSFIFSKNILAKVNPYSICTILQQGWIRGPLDSAKVHAVRGNIHSTTYWSVLHFTLNVIHVCYQFGVLPASIILATGALLYGSCNLSRDWGYLALTLTTWTQENASWIFCKHVPRNFMCRHFQKMFSNLVFLRKIHWAAV